MGAVGFTTSIPVEVLLAAGKRPVDLNNAFICAPEAHTFVHEAERGGFPSTCCAWMRGIYGVLPTLDIDEVIAVVRGDCSQTQALMEVLQMEGTPVYPFAYPYDRSPQAIGLEIWKLRERFGVREEDVENRASMSYFGYGGTRFARYMAGKACHGEPLARQLATVPENLRNALLQHQIRLVVDVRAVITQGIGR